MMGHTLTTQPPGRKPPVPWRRRARRRWTRPSDAASPAKLFASIPSLPRSALSRLTHAMIDHMDEIDGDPEAEDGDEDRCSGFDDDPACSHAQRGNDYGAGDLDDAEDSYDEEEDRYA